MCALAYQAKIRNGKQLLLSLALSALAGQQGTRPLSPSADIYTSLQVAGQYYSRLRTDPNYCESIVDAIFESISSYNSEDVLNDVENLTKEVVTIIVLINTLIYFDRILMRRERQNSFYSVAKSSTK